MKLLFTPGPVPMSDEVRMAAARQVISHRSPEFSELLAEVEGLLKRLLRTENDVILLTSSGTGGMEAAIATFVGRGGKVLVPTYGVFSERFAQIAETLGAEVHRLELPWGSAPRPEDLEEALSKIKPDAVAVVYGETSTGAKVVNIDRICELAHDHGALIIVDAISVVGGEVIETDRWKIDILVGASQKCLGAPPGLAFISVSEEAWRRAERARRASYYFDLLRYREFIAKRRQLPFTPAVNTIFALAVALRLVLEEGLEQRERRLKVTARVLTEVFERMGCEAFPEEWCRLHTVLVHRYPEGVDPDAFHRILSEHEVVVARGLGKLRQAVFRVGNMVPRPPWELRALALAVAEAIAKLGIKVDLDEALKPLREVMG